MRRAARPFGLPVAIALVFAAACGTTPRAAHPDSDVSPPDVVFVIPLGTAAAQMRGDPAFTLPATIDVVVGQRIVVRNEDQAIHYFFYMPIMPGQEVSKTFDQVGQYGYSTVLSRSIGGVETLSVRVAPRTAAQRGSPR
jgi:hypothetical protein